MSKSKTGSPKLGSVPKSFKRQQNKSQRMKLKENTQSILKNIEGNSDLPIRKSHAWQYF